VLDGGGSSSEVEPAQDENAAPAVVDDSPENSLRLLPAQLAAAARAAGESATGADPTGGAWRVIEVPALSNAPRVVSSPIGWLALSNRPIGDSRAPSGYQSVVYRSRDGVHWALLSLGQEAESNQFWGLAYGSGRYVLAGRHYPGSSIFWSSSDAQHWTESPDPSEGLLLGGGVAYAHDRFFKVGFNYLTASEDGRDWRLISTTLLQEGGAAYGNGVYVLTGSGPIQTSKDGWNWQAQPLDCAVLPGCITDPSGGLYQGYHPSLLFAEGRFYTDEMSSEDGVHWRAEPGFKPIAHAGGLFFGAVSLLNGLPVWSSDRVDRQTLRVLRPARAAVTAAGRAETSIGVLDRDSAPPQNVNVEFEDGLTCEDSTCLLIGGRLLLVPPAGTAPLVDRVPRTAEGAPLLSNECPVSSQIWCDDYEARSGCLCHPEAPREPGSCQDVSQFRCAGRFTQRGNEWQLDELSRAGCACDAVDVNQPASFGLDCTENASVCTLPLTCLPVDATATFGPPPSPRSICTSACNVDADCPSWQATGSCAGPVRLHCSLGSCQPRTCP